MEFIKLHVYNKNKRIGMNLMENETEEAFTSVVKKMKNHRHSDIPNILYSKIYSSSPQKFSIISLRECVVSLCQIIVSLKTPHALPPAETTLTIV